MRKPLPEPRSGTITALAVQARDPERLNLSLDGEFVLGITRLLAAQERLKVGQHLDEAQFTRLVAAEEVSRATESAILLLTQRPRSEREVRDRLRQKGYPPEAIDPAIERLRELRYLDDEAFARFWVENRAANRPRGRRLLEQELRQKGVDRQVVAAAIDDEGLDERAAALELARAKAHSYRALEPKVRQQRLAAFLGRRGYGWDVIKPTLSALDLEVEEDGEMAE